jgi:hypothetical protein
MPFGRVVKNGEERPQPLRKRVMHGGEGAARFLRFKLDILAFGDLVAFDDVGTFHIIPGYGIDFPVADAIASLFVELVEADLFSLGSRLTLRGSSRLCCAVLHNPPQRRTRFRSRAFSACSRI